MKRLFILIAALILAVNSAITAPAVWALPRSVALRNTGNQAGYERLVRGLEPTLWLATDEGITVSGSNVTQWDSKIGSISFTQGTAANQPLLSTSGVENLFTGSEWLSDTSYFTQSGLDSVTADSTANPLTGSTDADTIVENSSAGAHYLQQQKDIAASGVNYRFSIYAKDNGRGITLQFDSTAFGSSYNAHFKLSDGTVAGSHANITATIQNLGSGWYRCIAEAASTGTNATANFRVLLNQNDTTTSYTGDGSSGAYVWGAQVSRSSTPLSYIGTTNAVINGSTTGRKGVVFDGSASSIASTSTLDDIFNADAKEGFVVLRPNQLSAAANQDILYDSGVDLIWRIIASSTNLQFYNDDGGGDSTTVSTTTTPQVVNYRHDGTNIYLLGATESSTASGSTASMAGTLTIGKRATAASEYLDGAIYEIITFDKVLSDNQRQAIIEGLESRYRID